MHQEVRIWGASPSGDFSCRSAYRALEATKVWELVINPTQWLAFKQIHSICWVWESTSPCFRSPVVLNVPWHIVVIASIWSIWKARNKLIFEGQPDCPRSTLSNIKSLAISWSNAYVLPKKLTTRAEIKIKWIAPPIGWCKLNTEGSVLSNEGKAAAGGLMRNERGSWIFGFSKNLRTCTITKAELLGLRMGLTLAWERRIEKIEVKIDSQVVINLIKGSDTVLHPLGLIIEDCKRLIRNPWTYILKHTLRNGNRCADALAKLGHDQAIDCCLNWDFPTEGLNEPLKDDFG